MPCHWSQQKDSSEDIDHCIHRTTPTGGSFSSRVPTGSERGVEHADPAQFSLLRAWLGGRRFELNIAPKIFTLRQTVKRSFFFWPTEIRWICKFSCYATLLVASPGLAGLDFALRHAYLAPFVSPYVIFFCAPCPFGIYILAALRDR